MTDKASYLVIAPVQWRHRLRRQGMVAGQQLRFARTRNSTEWALPPSWSPGFSEHTHKKFSWSCIHWSTCRQCPCFALRVASCRCLGSGHAQHLQTGGAGSRENAAWQRGQADPCESHERDGHTSRSLSQKCVKTEVCFQRSLDGPLALSFPHISAPQRSVRPAQRPLSGPCLRGAWGPTVRRAAESSSL